MSALFLTFALALNMSLAPAQTQKDEFVFNNEGEPESIDPAVATGAPDATIIIQMFEGLMARQSDWATLKPGMAESYSISKDLKTYTFKLRRGLKWSDGSPLTAKDFEYSWLRLMRPATGAQYSFWLVNNVVGGREYAAKPTAETAAKVGIKAKDDLTFVVTLDKPVSYFLQLTSEPALAPVKAEVVEKYGTTWTRPEHIVTNGPYKLVEWKVQDRIVMEKNPNFFDAASVKLKRIVALPIEDRQTGMNLYQQGKLDWSGTNGVPNSLVPSLRKEPSFRVFPGFITYFYRINTTRPPLNDIRVRQALALAIDRKQLTEKVTAGGEIPVSYFVPTNTGTYKSPQGLATGDYKSDADRARKLLAEAGFPGGKGFRKINILYNTDQNHKKIAQAVSQMWKKELGITAEPFNQEWKVYLKSQEAKDYDVSRSGWQGDYPDPATFLENFLSDSGNNMTGWANKEFDKIFAESNAMPYGADRNKHMAKAEEILLNEAPIAPIYVYTNFGFLRPEVVGFDTNLIDRPYFKYFSKK